jgi:hypothetical protein
VTDEAVKKQLEANREVSDRSKKEGTEKLTKGKPTPTQDENDRAKLGEHIVEHEDDGSGPDPHEQKNLEAQQHAQRGGYQTRQSQPARAEPHTTTRHQPRSE